MSTEMRMREKVIRAVRQDQVDVFGRETNSHVKPCNLKPQQRDLMPAG
jgi:hypothetical protein